MTGDGFPYADKNTPGNFSYQPPKLAGRRPDECLPAADVGDAAAARAWLNVRGQSLEGDHLTLWLNTSQDGKQLTAALRAYDAALRIER